MDQMRYDDAWGEWEVPDQTQAKEILRLAAENKRLWKALNDLLMSADCAWEENAEGLAWPEACENARAALEEKS